MGLSASALANLRNQANTGNFIAQAVIEMIDSAGVGLKTPARVASPSVNPASPGATVDGVTMAVGDRFLKNTDAAAANNGLWVWRGAAVAATRPQDFDSPLEVKDGTLIPVREGTYEGRVFEVVTDDPFILGTTAIRLKDVGIEPLKLATVTPVVLTAADRLVVTKLAAPGAVAVTLPPNPPTGMVVEVIDGTGDASGNNITVTPAAGTVNGGANMVIATDFGRARFTRTATEWLGTLVAPAGGPTGAAGGDLGGNYPNPAVAKIGGTAVAGASVATNVGVGDAGKVLKLGADGKAAGRVLETDGAKLDGIDAAATAVVKKTVSLVLADLTGLAGGDQDHKFNVGAALPANARILSVDVGEGTFNGFDNGGGGGTCTVKVGSNGNSDDIMGSVNVATGQTGFPKQGTPGAKFAFPLFPHGAGQVTARIQSNVDLNTATAFDLTINVWYIVQA